MSRNDVLRSSIMARESDHEKLESSNDESHERKATDRESQIFNAPFRLQAI